MKPQINKIFREVDSAVRAEYIVNIAVTEKQLVKLQKAYNKIEKVKKQVYQEILKKFADNIEDNDWNMCELQFLTNSINFNVKTGSCG